MDEPQAGGIQQVFLQIVLSGAAVLPAQHLLPAGNGPHKGQVVTAAIMAQQCLHLGGSGRGHRGHRVRAGGDSSFGTGWGRDWV